MYRFVHVREAACHCARSGKSPRASFSNNPIFTHLLFNYVLRRDSALQLCAETRRREHLDTACLFAFLVITFFLILLPILAASQFSKVVPLHKRLVSYFRKQLNLSHSPICLVCVNVYVGRQPATTKGEAGADEEDRNNLPRGGLTLSSTEMMMTN